MEGNGKAIEIAELKKDIEYINKELSEEKNLAKENFGKSVDLIMEKHREHCMALEKLEQKIDKKLDKIQSSVDKMKNTWWKVLIVIAGSGAAGGGLSKIIF